jgi:hypothetical protein
MEDAKTRSAECMKECSGTDDQAAECCETNPQKQIVPHGVDLDVWRKSIGEYGTSNGCWTGITDGYPSFTRYVRCCPRGDLVRFTKGV